MGRIDKPEYKKETPRYPVYVAKDFFALESELAKFAIDKELPIVGNINKKEMVHFVPVQGVQQWYIEKGALHSRIDWCNKDIPLYLELQNKLEQYYSWCRRREYAQKHSLEDYSKMATETIAIVDDIPF